jgi:hypothetical protein
MGSTTRPEEQIIGRRRVRRIRILYGFLSAWPRPGYGISRTLVGSSTRNAFRPAVSVT